MHSTIIFLFFHLAPPKPIGMRHEILHIFMYNIEKNIIIHTHTKTKVLFKISFHNPTGQSIWHLMYFASPEAPLFQIGK